ncbi:hypothetical protein XENTR_v10008033 [Xenopus tropicalis]|nr:hypothetical protein XENTR_v10008033 [Xenopus tropicalis]
MSPSSLFYIRQNYLQTMAHTRSWTLLERMFEISINPLVKADASGKSTINTALSLDLCLYAACVLTISKPPGINQ